MTVASQPATLSQQGRARPVNLRTDLGQLADLIELVFAPTMDNSGRAAIREMRYMSKMGAGLHVLGRMNELAHGISMGYVWEINGRVVGNVSVYPANWPTGRDDAWIIANVGVHPDFQRRGIARHLMRVTMDMLGQKAAKHIILQVDFDNEPAIDLYASLGFIKERAFTLWNRSSMIPQPPPLDSEHFITRRRPSEWQQEMAFAAGLRSQERGGIGWLRPFHESYFHRSLWQQFKDWITFSTPERLVIRDPQTRELQALLWLNNEWTITRSKLTLFAHPDYPLAAEALMNNALRRFRTSSIQMEHPHDDPVGTEILSRYRFSPHRTVWHMRHSF